MSDLLVSRRDALGYAVVLASATDMSRSEAAPASRNADFDFLAGVWNVRHRKLKSRLTGEQDWWNFQGTTQAWPLMQGYGSVDDNVLEDPNGPYRAVSLRRCDSRTGQWSIWWLDERTPTLGPPVVGAFENGVGSFYGDDTLHGLPIRVRFQWSDISARHARWEQAFSPDGGTSWEVNWIMQFSRRS